MKCFRLRCCVNNSFLVFHQGTKHSKTIKHSRFAFVFHTVFSCLDPLMKHSNSLFTYNMKANNVGEPSIIFNRRHEKDRTFIREVQMRWKGEKPKTCQKVVGYDANALYLCAIMQDMPTGKLSRLLEEGGFKKK